MADDELDILLIEDNPGDARLIEEIFQDAEPLIRRIDSGTAALTGVEIHHEERLSAGLTRLAGADIDVVLLDLGLPDSTGLDTLATLIDAAGFVPIVVLTGLRDEQVGIEAIQHGAQDYLLKDDVTSNQLVRAIHHAIERNQQERERVRQHQRLEALNTLTRDLMEAETSPEVGRYVVEAAEEMLDLPVTGVALYDDQKAALKLTAMTEGAEEVIQATELLERSVGAAWQAFTTADVCRVSPNDSVNTSDSAVTELAIFPLASHGVLVIGSTKPDGFSETDFEFVETVAGNVKSALDRVDHEQQLQEREQMLEEQNQTLERLNQINNIIRSIAQGLVEASTRQEIESVVCEQLADTGPYKLAWIGEHDMMTTKVTPRESAGSENGYLNTITRRTDGRSDTHSLAARAVQTRETQVQNNLAANPPFEPWQQTALEHGCQASIAVPVSYQDILYGVLTLYADEPGVFNEMEEAVLTELGNTIGYALNAVEQRQALISEQSIELEFHLHAGDPPLYRFAAENDCEFTFKNIVQQRDGPPAMFVTIRGVSPAEVLEFGGQAADVKELSLVSDRDDGALFEVQFRDSAFFSVLIEHGAIPQMLTATGATGSAVIRVPRTSNIRMFVDLLEAQFEDVELVGRRELDEPIKTREEFDAEYRRRLTERQEEILKTAYVSGFFESPRQTTAQELAGHLGVSQPTVSGHIREGERKLFGLMFDED